jgi:hypothetical protein
MGRSGRLWFVAKFMLNLSLMVGKQLRNTAQYFADLPLPAEWSGFLPRTLK